MELCDNDADTVCVVVDEGIGVSECVNVREVVIDQESDVLDDDVDVGVEEPVGDIEFEVVRESDAEFVRDPEVDNETDDVSVDESDSEKLDEDVHVRDGLRDEEMLWECVFELLLVFDAEGVAVGE